MANHSSILAWKSPWTEEPGGLQSMESQSQTRLGDRACMHLSLKLESQYFLLNMLSGNNSIGSIETSFLILASSMSHLKISFYSSFPPAQRQS